MNKTKCKLRDITTQIFDGKHGDCVDEKNSGYYFISVKDLNPYKINYNNARQINYTDFIDNYNRTKLEEGDTIYANTGDTIGKSLFIKENKYTNKTSFQKSVAVVKPNKSIVEPRYLFYVLQYLTPQLRNAATGSSQKNLLLSTMRDFDVEIHEINTQKKISKILGNIDDKIINNHKINNNLEEQIQLIYNYWFMQYNFLNEYNKPYAISGGKLIWNEQIKRNIPEGWKVVKLLNIVNWESNSQPPKSQFIYENREGYIRFIQNRDYDSNSYMTYIPYKKSLTTVTKLDILIDKYGDAGKVRYGIDGVFNVALAKINPKESKYIEYVRSYLGSEEIYNYLHNSCMASTRASLSEENLKSLNIVIPNDDILNEFQDKITVMRNLILSNQEENEKLTELKEFLLPMLMNGQINVDDIEI